MIVRLVKYFPKWNLHFFVTIFPTCFRISINLISSIQVPQFQFSFGYGSSPQIIFSTHVVYSSLFNFDNFGAFSTQIYKSMWGLPLTWNLIRTSKLRTTYNNKFEKQFNSILKMSCYKKILIPHVFLDIFHWKI